MPDEMQHNAIAGCALRLFVEKGYGATTTEDIAAQCRISKQTLYRLFPGKAALFAAVVQAHQQAWLDLLPDDERYDDLNLDEALERIFRIDISEAEDRARTGVIRLVMSEGRNFPELAEILQRHGADVGQAVLADWLARQCARGRVVICDTREVAHMLMDMIFSAIIVKGVGELAAADGAWRRAHVRNCIRVFLYGVCAAGKAAS